MTAADELVFLLDVDNTLLDNDRVQDDLRAHLASEFGPASRDRYWETFDALRAELGYAVEGRVLIYIHKEQMLADLEQRYPARHYVMVDDKLRILAAMKTVWGERLITVFPRHGHYALDPGNSAAYPLADITIECIGELISVDCPALPGTHHAGRTQQEAS
jgi:hypothetical protein